MDYFYEEHKYDENYIRNMWKVPIGRDEKDFKKVIIAPHYTVGNTSLLKLSTFADNMFFWRFIAKNIVIKFYLSSNHIQILEII